MSENEAEQKASRSYRACWLLLALSMGACYAGIKLSGTGWDRIIFPAAMAMQVLASMANHAAGRWTQIANSKNRTRA